MDNIMISEQLFKVGDKVETTNEYKKQMEEWNQILERTAPVYLEGIISSIQTVTDYELKNHTTPYGMIMQEVTSKINKIWICLTLDCDPDKQINQIYCRKENEK